ncbi:MAG TPA: PqqD family protein [Drouetiella sp.]
MTSEVKNKPYFKLGMNYFHVNHCNDDFARNLQKCVPMVDEMPVDGNFYDCNMGCSFDLRELFNHMLKRHFIHIWLDAASLVSPGGKKLLIAGKSSSGKSTTSMALALSFNFKVLSEDITLIDPNTDAIVNFASPFSLKAGTIDLLQRTFGIELGDPYFGEWIPLGEASYGKNVQAPYDAALLFELDKNEGFKTDPITPSDFTRHLLPYSNFVKKEGALEKFMGYLPADRCFHIVNGSLEERIAKIGEIIGEQITKAPLVSTNAVTKREERSTPAMVAWKPVKPTKKKFQRHPEVQMNLLPDGHLVLSDQASSWAYTLTPLGSIVWEFLDGNNSEEDIVREIQAIDEIPAIENLQEQVTLLISELNESGLLVD